MTTGELIREARRHRKMTQKELGELCGIAEPTIRRYELGLLNPKYGTLCKIAAALDYDPGWFLPEQHNLLSIDLQQIFMARIRSQIEAILSTTDPADFFEVYGTYDLYAPFADLWDGEKPLTKARLEEIADGLGTSVVYLLGDDDMDGEKQPGKEFVGDGEHQAD